MFIGENASVFFLAGEERVPRAHPAGAARRNWPRARTAHSAQGRAWFWRGAANPCGRAPFWHPRRLATGALRWVGRSHPAGELRAGLLPVSSRSTLRRAWRLSIREDLGFQRKRNHWFRSLWLRVGFYAAALLFFHRFRSATNTA